MLTLRLGILGLTLAGFAGASAAWAGDCAADIGGMMKQREGAMQSINAMVTAAKGKQLDPAAFCARSQPLVAVENKLLAYMAKNKDWCQIPDAIIDGLKGAHAKSAGFAAKACGVAAQMKKMKEQAQNGGAGGAPAAPQLPTGPL